MVYFILEGRSLIPYSGVLNFTLKKKCIPWKFWKVQLV